MNPQQTTPVYIHCCIKCQRTDRLIQHRAVLLAALREIKISIRAGWKDKALEQIKQAQKETRLS